MLTDGKFHFTFHDCAHPPTRQEVQVQVNAFALAEGITDREVVVYEVKRVTSFNVKQLIESEEVT